MEFQAFYEAFLLKGLETFRKYYGFYRGTVARVDDPEKRGRIQAKVLQVGHEIAPNIWIDPAFDSAGDDHGSFFPPEIGDSVRVAFEHGRPDRPIVYIGGWYGTGDLPSELSYTEGVSVLGQTRAVAVPERRGFVSRKGQRLIFNDEKGKETVELAWHLPDPTDPAVTADAQGDRSNTADRSKGKTSKLTFNSDGDVVLTNANGSKVQIGAKAKNIVISDESGNVVTMDSAGVKIKTKKAVVEAEQTELSASSDTPAVRGTELMQYLASHTHGTAWGPSTPPIQPPPQTILSKSVKLR